MIKSLLRTATTSKNVFDFVEESLQNKKYAHIVSLNPENAVVASEDKKFYKIFNETQTFIIPDGVGIIFASKLLGIDLPKRKPGVDLMCELVERYKDKRILFLGGMPGSSEAVVAKYKSMFSGPIDFLSMGDVSRDDTGLISKVVAINPDILFVAFGSPYQEKWIHDNRERLTGVICMGVGGSLDFVSGKVPRAPVVMQRIGMEWLFRLILQPWRLRRQSRLLKYLKIVFAEKIAGE